MRLKRLETIGFKSFADRTSFAFEPGITAIIGPNGAGKSNVVDGIKWVLGETRPKSLRGGEMQDVVFKGAEGRAPAGFAEVTLILDNEDQALEGRGSEVAIGRRLFRTGESEYLVDRQIVRRKDVRELLLDTGLGVGAYSVMEQGKIDAVLSANPEDRRQIFEEASGISRFKLRRKETFKRLERTEQNLLRLGDLLDEKERHLRSLKIQAGRARRYQTLRARLITLRAALGVVETREAVHLEKEAGMEAEALAARQAELEAALKEAARALEEVRGAEGHLEREHQALTGSHSELRTREEGVRVRLRGLDQQAVALERRVGEASSQRERILASRSREEEEFFAAQDKARALAGALQDLEERLATARSAHADWAARARAALENRRNAEDFSLERLHEISRAGNLVTDAEARLRTLDESLQRLDLRRTKVEQELRETAVRIAGLQEESAIHEGDLRKARDDKSQAQAQKREAQERLAVLDREAQELRETLSGLVSRAEILRDLELSMAGLGEGARRVLEAGRSGVEGRLVDLLDCAPSYAKALEAALGERVHALVTRDLAESRAICRWLQEERLGFVHLVHRNPAPPDERPEPLAASPQEPGVLGRLYPHVQARPGSETLVRALLGDTVLVEDLEKGREASARLGARGVAVTVQGERLEGGILVAGGHTEAASSPIQRRSELKELDLAIRKTRADLADCQEQAVACREQAAAAGKAENEANLRLEKAAEALRRVDGDLLRAEERAGAATREKELLRLEQEESSRGRQEALTSLELAQAALQAARLSGSEADQELAAARKEVEAASAAKERASAEESQLRVNLASATSELEGIQARIAVLGRSVQENGMRVEELRGQAEEAQAGIERVRAESAALEEEARGLLEQRARLEQRLQVLQERRGEARDQGRSLEQRLEAGRADKEAVRSRLEERRFRQRELASGVGGRREKLLEEHGVDLEFFLHDPRPFGPGIAPGHDGENRPIYGPPPAPGWVPREESIERIWLDPGFDPVAARAEGASVLAGMEKIGAVNLAAMEELAEEEAAVDLLAREQADMKAARKTLQEMIDRIDQESARLFDVTFQQARLNFQEIFRKLFHGGKADILLTAGADPLEAGIEIMARPPGKQLQNINLLSGGERTLCALAILFGVFKVKPSPFAVLDEVDAALDDSNVDRFLGVVREFVDLTQFLVVTHNKRTMTAAGVLYGITMQRKGVSSCVSVRLDEVDAVEVSAAPA